ncbi:RNA polymerase subunit sigma-70 [Lewinellaceae bacterium SD302]|nr:RNA polymerase subunit sigma-70 [Lewinellaceae bacterium SD302]
MQNTQTNERIFHLFEQLRSGSETAMGELYADYSSSLYGQVYKLVPREEEASELLQDVFVKIWQNIDSYDRNTGRPYTWMARIARNRAIDHLRSARSKRNEKTDGLPDYVTNHSRLAEEQFVDAIGLGKVVDQLDPKYRELIEFLYFREYTQSEASKALDIPLGTVKTRARKAMQELRQILQSEIRSPLLVLVALCELISKSLKIIFQAWT